MATTEHQAQAESRSAVTRAGDHQPRVEAQAAPPSPAGAPSTPSGPRIRNKELRRVRVRDIEENPHNFRTHDELQRDSFAATVEEIGFYGYPDVFEPEPGRIMLVDGELRKQHLESAYGSDAEIEVNVTDFDPAEADKALATKDPLAAMAGVETARLDALLSEISESETSPEFQSLIDHLRATELEGLEQARSAAESVEEDTVPAVPSEPVTRRGDLIRLGRHLLLCGDCRDFEDVQRLIGHERINVAITSPPYASQRAYDESSGFEPIRPDAYVDWWEPIQANVAEFLAEDGSFFVNIKEHCEDGERVLYVKDLTLAHVRRWGWRFVDEFCWTHGGTPKAVNRRFKNGWEPVFQFTLGDHAFFPDHVMHETDSVPDWDGLHPSREDLQGASNAELQGVPGGGGRIRDAVLSRQYQQLRAGRSDTCGDGVQGSGEVGGMWVAGDGLAYPSNCLSLGKNREALGHSAAFPVSLPAFFIRAYSEEGGVVFDPFMGSGTTLIAAEQTNRRAMGMEISPAYCQVILQRWSALTGEDPVLESGVKFSELMNGARRANA